MRALALAATLAALSLPAAAQPAPCGPHDAITAMLAERWGETRRGVGLAGPTQLLELWASEAGTWSVLVTDTSGKTCLLASGQGWEDEREPEGEPA